MKKICSLILALALSAAFSVRTSAEDTQLQGVPARTGMNDTPKNEISLSYGTLTLLQFESGLSGILGTGFSGGLLILESISGYGAINLSYLRSVNGWLALGTDFSAEFLSMTFKAKETGNKRESKTAAFTPMATAKANWLRREHFGMYSRLSAGAMFMHEKVDNKVLTSFAFQASPVGMEFGGFSFRGFVELGFGSQGCILGGVKYRF